VADPDWSELIDAYGTAESIPGLLESVEPELDSPSWDDLWSRLCHQGTVYPASFAALPRLTQIARSWPAEDRFGPLVLAGAIVASRDQPFGTIDAQVEHAVDVGTLATLTEEAMAQPGVATEPSTYVCLFQALLAFEGVEVWGEILDGLNDGEYEVDCPECDGHNFIVLRNDRAFSTAESLYTKNTSTKRIPLSPADPTPMEGIAKRLHSRVVADGQNEIAAMLRHVFGRATCAHCDAAFRVDEAIIAYWNA